MIANGMTPDSTLDVGYSAFSYEDPWNLPSNAHPITLRRSTDGGRPRLQTEVVAYFDDSRLFILFRGDDDRIQATYRERDDPLYKEDVVELFLAPNHLGEYFELEVNPIGTIFDARIESPDGSRRTMRAEIGWECRGFWTALRRDYGEEGRSSFATVLAIPFGALGRARPQAGEPWRANFFRIDRSTEGDEFSAWQPTLRNPADFHVPAAFGELRFRL